jgi:hypothetical protein
MKRKLFIALVLAGMFVLGGISGAALMQVRIAHRIQARLLARGETPDVTALASALEVKLHLNSEQRAKVAEILRAHHPELAALMRSVEPQAQAIRELQWREIRPLLDAEQQKALDQLIQEQLARRRRLLTVP